jgi:hypothetical protein
MLNYSTKNRFRQKRFSIFLSIFNLTGNEKILDVGGVEETWLGTGLEKNVTLLNIKFSGKLNPVFKYIEADACNMEIIKSKEYDIAFSNSVIEHVGNFNRQYCLQEKLKEWLKNIGCKLHISISQ